ncbi:MAG: sulfotransferase [Cyanobacteriota bacterium]|nr:sulfotransferase [Cyanobacteriota bacterium]
MPDFIIVGAQKAGTTSLYKYLQSHPSVVLPPDVWKEIHYFNEKYNRGSLWYKSNFPIKSRNNFYLTFEASPNYMFYPHSASRITQACPNAKIIFLLRNPVDRAYSHYNHNLTYQRESRSFERAIEEDSSKIEGELQKMLNDQHFYSKYCMDFAYLHKSIYVDQLARFLSCFPRNNILVLETEKLFGDTHNVFLEVQKFLNLPIQNYQLKEFKPHNTRNYSHGLDLNTRRQLTNYFSQYNHQLFELIGIEFDWD